MHLSAPNYANSRVVPAADPRETTRKHVGKTTGSDFTSPTAALMSQTGRLRASGHRRVRKRQKIVLHARRLFQGAVHCTPYRAAGIDDSNPDTGSTGKADWPNEAYCRILAELSCRNPARPARSGPCLTLFRPLLEWAGEIGSRVERSRRTKQATYLTPAARSCRSRDDDGACIVGVIWYALAEPAAGLHGWLQQIACGENKMCHSRSFSCTLKLKTGCDDYWRPTGQRCPESDD